MPFLYWLYVIDMTTPWYKRVSAPAVIADVILLLRGYMQIWVDADACPAVIKDILYRAAERTKLVVTLVANQPLRVPPSPYIKTMQVSAGFDVADDEIVRRIGPGDLVITADIPLAAEVLAKEGLALNPRGELYRQDTIKQKLTMRDFMDTLRSSGIQTGGPAVLNQSDRKAFAAELDKLLSQYMRSKPK